MERDNKVVLMKGVNKTYSTENMRWLKRRTMIKEYIMGKGYKAIVHDLLSLECVRNMVNYNHHRNINTLMHGINVSYATYKICLKLRIEPNEIVKAALLHDFFLYDWHREKNLLKHAFDHPRIAVRNIEKNNLSFSKEQKEMILSHMFPFGPCPHSMGGWILTFADKYCTCMEIIGKNTSCKEKYSVLN